MTNRKVLRGKQGDHISLPSDRKVVPQIWQIAPETLTCTGENFLHFSTLETWTELTRACPTKGPVLGSLKVPLITAMDSDSIFLFGIVWSSSYCLQFRFFSSILKPWTQVTTKGPVRELCKLLLITAMDWPSCPH